ncbi:MAG: hypothetical protein RR135_00905 [Oscillospiraceae bacterium]
MDSISRPMPNEEMQRYFDELPPFVQENVMQSGQKPKTLEELRFYAQHLLHDNR